MTRFNSFLIKYFVLVAFLMSVFLVFGFTWLDNSDQSFIHAFFGGVKGTELGDPDAWKKVEPVELVNQISRNDPIGFVNCRNLFDNNVDDLRSVKNYLKFHNYKFPTQKPQSYDALTFNCSRFKKSRGYLTLDSLMDIERNFTLAFNILVHEKVEQFERLLRAIYRPNNQYCVHVDKKTPDSIMKAILAITKCFDNVFIASKLENVIYKSYTRLKADINCMKDHVKRTKPWRYLINMASSEFPIMTNLQMVQIAKTLNGGNDIHEVFMTMDKNRFSKSHFTYINSKTKTGHVIHSDEKKSPPPHNLVITKGNAYNLFSRDFIEFALTDRKSRDLLSWSADTLTPDEHYWATLNNLYSNPFLATPGGFKGHPDTKPFFGRYIGWNSTKHVGRCKGKHYVHNICVFGVEDLPAISLRNELIANKFDIAYDPIAYKCMEEWLQNKTAKREGIRNETLYIKIAQHSSILTNSIIQRLHLGQTL